MSLKSEQEAKKAVTKVNSKWTKQLDNLKRFGRHALYATVSTVSMLGSMPTMQAQTPVKEVPLEQLDAYLKGGQQKQTSPNKQQQYQKIYDNRTAYRTEQYGTPEWAEAHGYIYDAKLSHKLPYKYLGAFIDLNRIDDHGQYGVTYLPRDPVHEKKREVTMHYAISSQKQGTDMYHHDRNQHRGGYTNSTAGEIIHDVVHTVGDIIHMTKGRGR